MVTKQNKDKHAQISYDLQVATTYKTMLVCRSALFNYNLSFWN